MRSISGGGAAIGAAAAGTGANTSPKSHVKWGNDSSTPSANIEKVSLQEGKRQSWPKRDSRSAAAIASNEASIAQDVAQQVHRSSWPAGAQAEAAGRASPEVRFTHICLPDDMARAPRFSKNEQIQKERELQSYLQGNCGYDHHEAGSHRSGATNRSNGFSDASLMAKYEASKRNFKGVGAMEKYNEKLQNIDKRAAQDRVAKEIADTGKRYHGALDKGRKSGWSQDPLAHTTVTVRKGGALSGEISCKLSNEGTLK